MKLIVGLGNPGSKYKDHRHNIGFKVLDTLASSHPRAGFKKWGKAGSELAEIITQPQQDKILLLKPLTYMNLSGKSVLEVSSFYKINLEDICVIHDELDLPFGSVRLKIGGGAGGHNGLKSIISLLGSQGFARIRVGIGRPLHPDMDPADYVLSDFSRGEISQVDDMVVLALQGIAAFIEGPKAFLQAMNTMNQK